MDTEQTPQPAPSSVGTGISVTAMMRDLETPEHEQNAKSLDQRAIGESLMDMLCFKYADMPAGKHILIRDTMSREESVWDHRGTGHIIHIYEVR